ncbi:ShlB/FhaC/HecB family hemolysin secretion/activation protein [Caballeronia zhejiangensis]|uniref:ShlB/FhaC/HecB family hemolysin secretion/activation protein n=1 Tax=Caballeronia zhejiangensis TaxID=871203 RepID=UPI00158BC86F|nr:ShlB/FhaC/HecB family hemolysin secretion/activation protein [Caballeronia zhejiangensis]
MSRTVALEVCRLKPLSLAVFAFVMAAALPRVAHAQVNAPSSGQIENTLRQIEPIPSRKPSSAVIEKPLSQSGSAGAPEVGVKARISRVVFTGNSAYSGAHLAALLPPLEGKEFTLAELNAMADRITRFYREHGYAVARAYLPPQSISNGELSISVLEGRYDRAIIRNNSPVSDTRIRRTLEENACVSDADSVASSGEAGREACHDDLVKQASLERALLLIGDLPGVKSPVISTLAPGREVGTTDLSLDVAPGRSVTGFVSADNFSDDSTGEAEVWAGVSANSVALDGDQLSAMGLTTGRHLVSPILGYSAPIGYLGTRAGIQYSYLHYSLKSSPESYGTAQSYSAYVSHPLIRTLARNLSAQLTYSYRRYNDVLLEGLATDRKNDSVFTLSLDGNELNQPWGGQLTYNASFATGHLSGELLTDSVLHTSGQYEKVNVSFSQLQPVYGPWGAAISAKAQLASKNLDVADKLVLGGPTAVRAAGIGAAFADNGLFATAEARFSPALLSGLQTTFSAFYDVAVGQTNKFPVAGSGANSLHLAGYGLGVTVTDARKYSVRVYWARPTHAVPGDDHSRAWLQATYAF